MVEPPDASAQGDSLSTAFSPQLSVALIAALPASCTLRVTDPVTGALIASACVDDVLAKKGWDRDSFGATTLFTAMLTGEWTIPQDVHDRICGCQRPQRQSFGNPRESYIALCDDLLAADGLPGCGTTTEDSSGMWMEIISGCSRKFARMNINCAFGPWVDTRFRGQMSYSVIPQGTGWRYHVADFDRPGYKWDEMETAATAREALDRIAEKLRAMKASMEN